MKSSHLRACIALVLLWSFLGVARSWSGPLYEPVVELQLAPYGGGRAGLTPWSDGNFYGVTASGGAQDAGTIFRYSPAGGIKVLINFTYQSGPFLGRNPGTTLVPDGAGNLWGTTRLGGAGGHGTVFKYRVATGEFTTVVDFTGEAGAARGEYVSGTLYNDGAGFFWGTTEAGGSNYAGTIFKIEIATGVFTNIAQFNNGIVKGATPLAGLTKDAAGTFWGTTSAGGSGTSGTVFKLNPVTGAVTTVLEFAATGNTPRTPSSALMDDGAGFMWGTSSTGGASNFGTVYKVNIATGALTTVVQFSGTSGTTKGTNPYAPLVKDGLGNLWGSTYTGGTGNDGTIFRVNVATGAFATMTEFTDASSGTLLGAGTQAPLLLDGQGNFLGVNTSLSSPGRTVFKVNIATGAAQTLAQFRDAGEIQDPNELYADPAGLLWSTARSGPALGRGAIFQFNPVTRQIVIGAAFAGTSSSGQLPSAGVASDGAGFLWGATFDGGSSLKGTVFKFNPATNAVSYPVQFTGTTGAAKGANPVATPVYDGVGAMWGATISGGAGNQGVVYKVDRSTGAMSTVLEFTGSTGAFKGGSPTAKLLLQGGFLWGVTRSGGGAGSGTIYKIEVATGAFTDVLDFANASAPKGNNPSGALVADGSGNLWGTTTFGGSPNLGTVFKYNPGTGVLQTIVEFTGTGGTVKGSQPFGGLVRDAAGNFWGTTYQGGSADLGTLFRITPQGVFTSFLEFSGTTGAAPGENPDYGAPILHPDGHIYGTTSAGGQGGGGVLFRLRFGPAPKALAADGITPRTAVLHGSMNPNGLDTTARFQFGTSPVLANAVNFDLASVPAGVAPVPVSYAVANLLPSTTYYYRVAGKNSENSNEQWSDIQSFTTAPLTPPVGGSVSPVATGIVGPGVPLTATFTNWTDAEGETPLTYQLLLDGVPVAAAGSATTIQFTSPAGDGVHTVTGRIIDFYGAQKDVNQQFTVDAIAPVVGGPFAPLTIATGQNGTVPLPDYVPQAMATDAVGVTGIVQQPPAGTAQIVGTTLVTLTASDAVGNQGSTNFLLQVTDGTKPDIAAPAGGFSPPAITTGVNATALLPDYTGQAVTADNVGVTGITQDPPAGSARVAGTTTITLTATDAAGNTQPISFDVAVLDGTVPVITAPEQGFAPLNLTTGVDGTVPLPDFTGQPVTSDNVAVTGIVQDPAPGSARVAGVTTVTLTIRDAAQNSAQISFAVAVADGTKPEIAAPAGGFSPLEITAGPDGLAMLPDYTGQAITSDNVGVTSVTQIPAPGTARLFGETVVTLTAHDAAGNSRSLSFPIVASLDGPVLNSLAATGASVPGAGLDARIPAEAKFSALGLPAVNDRREVCFLGKWKAGRLPGSGIFVGSPPALLVAAGEDAPGIFGARFKVLQDPLLAPDGTVAFAATVQGMGIKATNDQGVWLSSGGALTLVLREGTQITGVTSGFTLKTLLGLSLRNGELLVAARLAPVRGLVGPANDLVLLRVTAAGATVLLRKNDLLDLGDGFPAARVSTMTVLLPATGSQGHGRWQADGAATVRVNLDNGRQVALCLAADGSVTRSIGTGDAVSNIADSAVFLTMNVPAIEPGGQGSALRGILTGVTLPGLPPIVTKKNDAILAFSPNAATAYAMFAREGEEAPGASGLVFGTFSDPLVNDAEKVAFVATLSGLNVTLQTNTGVWWGAPDHLQLLARTNSFAPGPDGQPTDARWDSFVSLALPSGPDAGPVLLARVRGKGVTARNSTGLWAVDTTGLLRQLLRTGDLVEGKAVTGIQTLAGVPTALGASRGFNERGTVTARVQLARGGQAIVRIDVPTGKLRITTE